MNWVKIDRANRIQHEGKYQDWKQQISDECHNQCVYCSIHEAPWGGIDHYHIEHYRPKSKFAELEHVITNLYHSCPICNRFKSDDWPGNSEDLQKICYPDPSDHDYKDLFNFDLDSYLISGKYVSASYVVNRLFLNRPQLIYERREQVLRTKADALIQRVQKQLETLEDTELSKKAFKMVAQMHGHLTLRFKIAPYKLIDIRKSA